MISTTNCPLCGYPVDPYVEHHIVPLARVHPVCLRHDGRSLAELERVVPRCAHMNVFRFLAGKVIEASPDVPPNEVWVNLPEEQRVKRFGLAGTALEPTFVALPDLDYSEEVEGSADAGDTVSDAESDFPT